MNFIDWVLRWKQREAEPAAEQLEVASGGEFVPQLKHHPGGKDHNQKRHGWRFARGGDAAAKLSAARRALRGASQAERDEYRKRAGMQQPKKYVPPPPKPAPAPPPPAPVKPKRTPKPKVVKPPKPPKPPKPAPPPKPYKVTGAHTFSATNSQDSHNDFHADPGWQNWINGLTPKEVHALKQYIGKPGDHSVCENLNRGLRTGSFNRSQYPNSNLTAVHDGLDSALAKGTLHRNTNLFRTIDFSDMYYGAQNGNYKPGQVVTDAAFCSTAPKKGTSTGWYFMKRTTYPVMWKIKAAKGTKGAYMSWTQSLNNPYMHESEFLLPRNSQFRIDKISMQTVNGRQTAVYEMTLLP